MRPRLGPRRLVLLVLTPLLLFYAFLIASVAWAMIRDPRFASRGTGLALLVLVAVGVGLVVAELRFGRQVEALSREYDVSAISEDAPLPLRPSGRPHRDAADAAFDRVSERVRETPHDWRGWYELGLAYGDARDTMRGRRALRKAVALHREGAK
jgi:cytochrome c-type biogenesis protein CcmH/NrfG